MVRVVTPSSSASASMAMPCRDVSSACSTFHWRMTSWLRGTGGLVAFLGAANLAPAVAVGRARRLLGRAEHAFGAAHLDLLRRRLWRDVVVERPRLGLLHVGVDQDAHDDVLIAPVSAVDADAIALLE